MNTLETKIERLLKGKSKEDIKEIYTEMYNNLSTPEVILDALAPHLEKALGEDAAAFFDSL
jgi:hypothetical protein